MDIIYDIILCHTDPSIPDVAGTFSGCEAQIWMVLVLFARSHQGRLVCTADHFFVTAFFGRIFKTCLGVVPNNHRFSY